MKGMVASLDAVSDLRRPGRLYKLAGDRFAIDAAAEGKVDEKTMSATAIISTPTPDRVNDSMNPQGILLDKYKLNPVVLVEHGFYHPLPIATSEDPDGNLTVIASADGVRATSYFDEEDLVSRQVFNLVKKKILRATSVRFSIKESRVENNDGDAIYFIDEWDLEEWSWCAIGCNPEAIAEVVSKNRLAGKPIAEPLLKSLQIWTPQRAAQSTGWTPDKELAMAKTNATTPAAPKTITKADEPKKPEDETTPPADEPKADAVPADEAEEGEGEQQKFGAQLLTGVHASLSDLATNLSAGRAMLENPDVSAALDEAQPLLEQALSIVAGCYSSAYGKELAPADEPKPDEMAKSFADFMATGNGPRFELAGVGGALRSLAKAANLDGTQKKSVRLALARLESLVERAKAKPAAKSETTLDPAKEKAIGGVIGEMRAGMAEIKKMIDDIRPFQPAA